MAAPTPPPAPDRRGATDVPPFDTAGLERRVAAEARARGLLGPGDRVLVAVSAGADSAAMAGLLAGAAGAGLPLDLVLAHVDHGWRGPAEAAADRATVEALAGRLGLPLVLAPQPETVRRTEADARRHRYASLDRLARARGCGKVATGHHLRDHAETLVLRLARGSGAHGLAAIPRMRSLGGGGVHVVRPVLDVDPRELRAYAEARGLPWREDLTNADPNRDRARVRARLEAAGARRPTVVFDLARLAHRLADRVARRGAHVAETIEGSLSALPEARTVAVDVEVVSAFADADLELVLRRMGSFLRADADGPWLTRRLVGLVGGLVRDSDSGGVVSLPHGLEAARHGRRLLLCRTTAPSLAPMRIEAPGADGARATVGPDLVVRWENVARAAFDLEAFVRATRERGAVRGASVAAMDARALGPHVTLRAIAPDDAFTPLGGSRPVRVPEFLARHGFPERIRRGVRVAVAADGRVVWVVGVRIDASAAIGPATATVAHLSVEAGPA